MKHTEVERLNITDDLGNDLLTGASNLVQEITSKIATDIVKKREAAFLSRLAELEIEFDADIEQHKRFKRFAKEIKGEEETIYFNDGSINGQRIITFVTKQTPFDPDKFSIGYETTYY